MNRLRKEHSIALLMAGFVLGNIVGIRRRVTKASRLADAVSPNSSSEPKDQINKRPFGFLANNVVIAGIVSAITAGTMSFFIAKYQSQDAGRQALAGQQISVAIQLESAATSLWQASAATVEHGYRYAKLDGPCIIPTAPSYNTLLTEREIFWNDRINMDDGQASYWSLEFYDYAIGMAYDAESKSPKQAGRLNPDEAAALKGYSELIARCGQLIRGS